MRAKDIRNKNTKELNKLLLDQKKELEKFMHEVYKGKEKNVAKVKMMRKGIARICSVLSEKKFMEESKNV